MPQHSSPSRRWASCRRMPLLLGRLTLDPRQGRQPSSLAGTSEPEHVQGAVQASRGAAARGPGAAEAAGGPQLQQPGLGQPGLLVRQVLLETALCPDKVK